MRPVWDGDVLLYQCGFAAESYWKMIHEERWEQNDIPVSAEEAEEFFLANPPPFDVVQSILEDRINNTHAIVETNEEPTFFFTGKENFRNEISTTGYKNRVGRKPFHYRNIKAFLEGKYNCITVDGIEADDALSIEGTKDPDNTIIIGIDKDLLQVPCWHYMFEYGKVAAFGPHKVEGYGSLWMDGKKIRGYGNKFFLAQCIMGDRVDSIIGLPKSGPVAALKLLGGTKSYQEGLEAVMGAYRAFYGLEGIDKLVENARLLWMVRELDEEGNPVMWRIDVDYG